MRALPVTKLAPSRIVAVALMTVVVGACASGGGSLSASQAANPTPNVQADPTLVATTETPEASQTFEPTISSAPETEASVVKVREMVRGCEIFDDVQATVIVELKNEGTGWAKLNGGDYTIYDDDENVLGTGSFLYAYPTFLAPGKTGYLAETAFLDDAEMKDIKRVEADGTYDDVEVEDVIELTTDKVQIKRDDFGDGLFTTGTVTNASSEDLDSVHVGSVFLSEKGNPIGYASTNLVDNLTAGKTKGFETLASGCPVKRSDIEHVRTHAGALVY